MTGLLIALALTAGAVAAFNPCGAALFPSYLALLFEGRSGGRPIASGLAAGLLMTLGFITVFGLAGLLVASLSQVLFHLAPFVSLAVGVMVLVLGVLALFEKVRVPVFESFLLREERGHRSLAGRVYFYGIAYAFCSLSCALPVFLAIAVQAASRGFTIAMATFLMYALGMGAVITAASILTFVARGWVQSHILGIRPYLTRLMGLVLTVSGLYLLWYWLLGPEHLLA